MLPLTEQRAIGLAARSIHRIEDGAGLLIECLSGVLWLTQHGDHRDITLERGQAFRLDRDGLAIVYALQAARFRVASASPEGRQTEPTPPKGRRVELAAA
jgi:hypothetical protein